MKIKGWLFSVFLGLFASNSCFGQAPPLNDNYSNSIPLIGTDVTFSGTLAGATLEDSQETVAFGGTYYAASVPTESVWWNWTAPVSTALTLEILSSTVDPFQPQGL